VFSVELGALASKSILILFTKSPVSKIVF